MERRTFLKWVTNGLGAIFAAILGVPAIAYLIDPRNRPAPAGDFKPVAKLSELEIGVPKQAIVRDIRKDAWTLHPNDVLGRVWLIRRDKENVEAFTTICPHLGGSINFDKEKKRFVCPLHGATFDFKCERVPQAQLGKPNPAPRRMDSLNCALKEEGGDTIIAVKYENFQSGIPEKKSKA